MLRQAQQPCFDRLSNRLGRLSNRLGRLSNRSDRINNRLGRISNRFGRLNNRLIVVTEPVEVTVTSLKHLSTGNEATEGVVGILSPYPSGAVPQGAGGWIG